MVWPTLDEVQVEDGGDMSSSDSVDGHSYQCRLGRPLLVLDKTAVSWAAAMLRLWAALACLQMWSGAANVRPVLAGCPRGWWCSLVGAYIWAVLFGRPFNNSTGRDKQKELTRLLEYSINSPATAPKPSLEYAVKHH